MTPTTALVIVSVANIAFLAEILLYPRFGMGAALTPQATESTTTFLLFALMAFTISTAILAPLSALVEQITKRRNYGLRMMVAGWVGVLVVLLYMFRI